jgi:H+/Cl- antiporter ClcA
MACGFSRTMTAQVMAANHKEPDFFENLQHELRDARAWFDRAIVLSYAVSAGLSVVAFTLLAEWCFELFGHVHSTWKWAVLIWIPALTMLIVWLTRTFFAGAAGSGIPQVMTALDPYVPPLARRHFVSLRLTIGKVFLSSLGLLAGLSLGREGPSVQVAAGIMHNARRWIRPGSALNEHALLVAGGAAGIAAAFNAPLAGVVFAIEELGRKIESRSSGLMIAAIVVAGLVSVSVFGNYTYFGSISVPDLSWKALGPGLLVAVVCGLAGGLFSRLLIMSLTNAPSFLNRWRGRYPIWFAGVGGLAIAVIGLSTGGATFGAGGEEVRRMLEGQSDVTQLYAFLKFIATWVTTWVGVPGGIFAPSLSIGAGIGNDIAQLVSSYIGSDLAPVLIAIGMASFLAAVTQAPLTSFIIVMEMIDGRALVLSLMTGAMLASLVSRLVSRPLYTALSEHMGDPYVPEDKREARAKAAQH